MWTFRLSYKAGIYDRKEASFKRRAKCTDDAAISTQNKNAVLEAKKSKKRSCLYVEVCLVASSSARIDGNVSERRIVMPSSSIVPIEICSINSNFRSNSNLFSVKTKDENTQSIDERMRRYTT